MTLREKLADFITGGKFALYKEMIRCNQSRAKRDQQAQLQILSELMEYRDALCKVRDLETPRMADVGKRAVAIAKKALGE